MKIKKKIFLAVGIIIVLSLSLFIFLGGNNSSKGDTKIAQQTEMQGESKKDEISTTKQAIDTEELNEEQTKSAITTTSTNQAINIAKTGEKQAANTNKTLFTLSKNEIISGTVLRGGIVGDSGSYTFTTDELTEFIDTVNGYNLSEKDCEGTSKMHTASATSVNVVLTKSDSSTSIVFSAYLDGQTNFADYQNSYNFFNKNLSSYILNLDKYFYSVDTTTDEAIQN